MGEGGFTRTKTILSTHSLYGVTPDVFLGMKYEDALSYKIDLANDKLKKIMDDENWWRSEHGGEIPRILAAIKHNTELLEEMGLRYHRNNDE